MSKLDPQAHFGFLVHDVARLLRASFDDRAQGLGLTRAQWRVLVHLGPREGINQRALAEILELDNVTLGRHIDKLEAANWLERRADPNDRRAWLIYLSEAARPTIDRMGDLADQLQTEALSGVSEEDRALLVSTLTRIKDNLTGTGDEAVSTRERKAG